MGNHSPYRIGSLERALLVVDTLAEVPDASVAELAQLLGVAKGSLFRHLKVLEAKGYVLQSPGTKRYSLGPRLLYLGHAARKQLRLPEVAAPLMTALRDRFNETVHMGVLSRGEVVHVEVAPSTHPVKMAAEVGDRTWAHVSGLGKVLLAWGGDDAVEFVLRERGLPSLTDRTIVDRAALDVELERIRSHGYAIDDEESARGLRCVAAPVRDGRGEVRLRAQPLQPGRAALARGGRGGVCCRDRDGRRDLAQARLGRRARGGWATQEEGGRVS